MAKYFEALDTPEGTVLVLTKTRWAMLVPMSHTSVMPHRGAELKNLGSTIKWDTKEPALLRTLHQSVVGLVKQIGLSGIRDVAETTRMAQDTAKMTSVDWREIVIRARASVKFPVPDD